MELPILYEDADIVAINKPSGLLTHLASPNMDKSDLSKESAGDWFKAKYPEVALERPYVHRLDRDTSGVLVFAKNKETYDFLRTAFTNRDVQKTYLAIVAGVPNEKMGIIDFDIGRSRKDFRLRSAQPKARGALRNAITRYEVVGELEEAGQKYSLLEVHPETGRTHQIRVHLKAINHPVLADPLYAGKRARGLGLPRLALHAYAIDLPLPSGGHTEVIAPFPNDLAQAFAKFSSTAYLQARIEPKEEIHAAREGNSTGPEGSAP